MSLTGDTWTRVELPTDTADVTIIDEAAVGDEVHLLAREDGALVVYALSAAGDVPARIPLDFDDPARVGALGLVEVGGEPVLIGWTLDAATTTLAAWFVTEGDPVAVDIEGVRPELEAEYDEAISLDDGTALVAGELHNRNAVWEIAFDGGAS